MGYLTGQAKPPSSEVPQVGADRKEVKDSAGKVLMMLNPDFEDWDAADQQVMSYLLGSLSKEILIHVSTCTTVTEAWVAIQGVFASRMHACTVNIDLPWEQPEREICPRLPPTPTTYTRTGMLTLVLQTTSPVN
jgi:hypothetical protein